MGRNFGSSRLCTSFERIGQEKPTDKIDSVQKPCSRQPHPVHDRETMNYNLATILAVIAILFVLLTYVTGAPLVPVAVILLGLAIIFGGSGFRRV
jgi:hypothetical protein